MYLELENICGFKYAKVHIDGITVIAGNNNTGKSTIGKSLLLMFNSMHNLEKNIIEDKINAIQEMLDMTFRDKRRYMNTRALAVTIYNEQDSYINNYDALQELFLFNTHNTLLNKEKKIKEKIENEEIVAVNYQINRVLTIPDETFIEQIIGANNNAIFKGTISNKQSKKSSLNLFVKNKEINFKFTNNTMTKANNIEDFYTKAVYIDNPFIIDDEENMLRTMLTYDYRIRKRQERTIHGSLFKMLFQSKDENLSLEILKKEGLKEVFNQLNMLGIGDLKTIQNKLTYKSKELELPVANISTGLKVFLIIKILLLNGSLQENGTLILDEPEIHLHPEWQLVFAEIMVLLQKIFGLHILLTTHSPYFLKAIEAYSEKHKIKEKCRYYLTDCKEKFCTIEELKENTQEIYEKFFEPFQTLELVRAHA